MCVTRDKTAIYYAFGDSITYGQIGGGSGQSRYNYPACVGKLLHMLVSNQAVGGQGIIKDWSTIQRDFVTNLDMTGAELITVAWAYNDAEYYGEMRFGSFTDTGDTTFVGKYYTVMKQFQQKCPLARIILITGFGYSDGQVGPPIVKPTLRYQFTHKYSFFDGEITVKQMYDTLEDMCHLHGWNCINQAKGTVFNEFNAGDLIGDQIHQNDLGYQKYGNYLVARIASLYSNIVAW